MFPTEETVDTVDPMLLPVELAIDEPPPPPDTNPESHQGTDELPLPLDETVEEPSKVELPPVEVLLPDPV